VKRWLLWFALAPQGYLAAGLWRDAGLPPFDMGALWCVFLAFFAQRATVPWLLLGGALGRSLVDEASLPVQILVLGVPIAVLLPMRHLVFGQRWLWQALFAASCALVIPKLAGLFGRWFDQPSASAQLDGFVVLWSALLVPPLLLVARALPPCRAFEDTP
jgi:hypothetical protein